MGYDPALLNRIRELVSGKRNVTEAKMFGGVAIMVKGNMAVAIRDAELFVRLGEEGARDALQEDHVRVMDITGRVMKNYVTVSAAGIAEDSELKRWVDRGIAYARSLPKK